MKKILLFATVLMACAISNAQTNKAYLIKADSSGALFNELSLAVTNLTVEAWINIDPTAATTPNPLKPAEMLVQSFTVVVDFRHDKTIDPTAVATKTEGFVIKTDKDTTGLAPAYEWGGDWKYLPEGGVITPGEWHHVAWVVDASVPMVYIYLDGEKVGEDTATDIGKEAFLETGIAIGHSVLNKDRTFIGLMDEVRVWNVARSATDIANNMRNYVDESSQDLIAYYKCDDNSGDKKLDDASTNDYNADIVGEEYEFVESTVPDFVTAISTSKVNSFEIYPNPVKGSLTIKGMDLTNAEINIYNAIGKLVASPIAAGSDIEVANIEAGLYFVNIKKGSQHFSAKMIKE